MDRKGLSIREGVSPFCVYKVCRQLGIKKSQGQDLTDSEISLILECLSEESSRIAVSSIAEEFGVSWGTVKKYATRIGIFTSVKKPWLSKEEAISVKSLFRERTNNSQLATTKDIAKKTGRGLSTVHIYATRLGMMDGKTRRKRYTKDEESRLIEFINKTSFVGRPCPICDKSGHGPENCPSSTDYKRCSLCSELKPRTEFISAAGRSGRCRGRCAKCHSEYNNANYIRNFGNRTGRATEMLRGAKARDPECSLTVQDIITMYDSQMGKCYYSGIPMTFGRGDFGFSLDRRDNQNRRYSKENVVLCCWRVNQMKHTQSVEDLMMFSTAISNNTRRMSDYVRLNR